MHVSVDVNILKAMAVLGVVLAMPRIYDIVDFFWLYFLRPSSVKRYLHGETSYALVTGATGGIGKATAAELLGRGFNLILHGKDEPKMRKVVEELRASVKGKGRGNTADIRYFIAEASSSGHDFAKLVEPFKGLHITVVVNNVGGMVMGLDPSRVDERPEERVMRDVNLNALFPFLLTRALLPQLRRATDSGPVQVLFVGSFASDLPPPLGVLVYAASKSFQQSLVGGLDVEERSRGTLARVGFTYLAVGVVQSDNHPIQITLNWKVPTSPRYAWWVVESIGCGRRRIVPYMWHALHFKLLQARGHIELAAASDREPLEKQDEDGDGGSTRSKV